MILIRWQLRANRRRAESCRVQSQGYYALGRSARVCMYVVVCDPAGSITYIPSFIYSRDDYDNFCTLDRNKILLLTT